MATRPWLVVLVAALALAGWRTLDPDPDMHLDAKVQPDGRVVLTWSVPRGAVAMGLSLRRTYAGTDLDGDPLKLPISTFALPATVHGRYVDAAVASGVAYTYGLEAGKVPGERVEVSLPPARLPGSAHPTLWVDKSTYTLAVEAGGKVLKRYPVALGSQPRRRKLHFDNASTPEGVYHVVAAQPRATYYRAFDLDYPNATDRARYEAARKGKRGFPAIGGEVQLHGRGIATNWTWGCVALRDEDMDELFAHPEIGPGTEVDLFGGELSRAQVEALR